MQITLYQCGCIGFTNFCADHGKPPDTSRRLKRCPDKCNNGRTQESMNEDKCLKCSGIGFIVVDKKTR
jgi:hypothetical protein